jgi:hypothetical protein
MKKLLFILTISIFLLSCEKNYSCICKDEYTDQFGYAYVPSQVFTWKLKDIKSTKHKAKKECDQADMVGLDTLSGAYVIRDCSITKFE